jgi:hypothetical protein
MAKAIPLALLSVLLMWSTCNAASPLFGKWTVTFTPDESPGDKAFTDTLVFTHEQLHAETLRKQGFEPAAYEEDTRRYGPATFTATQASEQAGKLEWSGTAVNQEMTGKLKWTKADGKAITYTLKGTKIRE